MDKDPVTNNLTAGSLPSSPDIGTYTKSLKDLLEELGTNRDDAIVFDEIHQNEATAELEWLIFNYHPDAFSPKELGDMIQAHLDNGANPYAIFMNGAALTNTFSSPAIMQTLINNDVDFNVGQTLTGAPSPKELCTQIFDTVLASRIGDESSGQRLYWEDYAKSQEILIKAFPDFKPDMDTFLATEDTKEYFKEERYDFTSYMTNRAMLETCVEHGIFSKEDTDKFLKNHSAHVTENAKINQNIFHDKRFNGVRVGFAEYYTKAGDTLPDIARRFKPYIGEGISYGGSYGTMALISRIIEENELDSDDIHPGMTLRIPVDPDAHFIAARAGDIDITTTIFHDFYKNTGDLQKSFIQIGNINNINGPLLLDPAAMLHIPVKERFNKVASLDLPENKDVTLGIVETSFFPSDYGHHRETFETASKLDYFRSGGDGRHVIAISTFSDSLSTPLDLLLYQSQEARNGNTIFSKSFSFIPVRNEYYDIDSKYDGAEKLYSESVRVRADFFEKNNTITFVSIGNDHDTDPNTYPPTESGLAMRGVTVGAIHEENGIKYIAGYSSSGADICAGPIHPIDGKDLEGTSFSNPDFASLYRNMASAYGNDLTHEEIMVAAFYSTNMDIKDYDPHAPPNGYWSDAVPMVDQMDWAKFEINGAGVPYHDRAGRGMIDSDKWIENLERMKALKLSSGNESEIVKQHTNLRDIEPEVIKENGKELYVYKIPLSEDMTLGKISMNLPQEQYSRSRSFLESPSGMDIHMPYLRKEMFSTFALACEDIKEGQFLTLKTEERYTNDADIIIRGFKPGNTIEAFRDLMLQNNLAQAPNSTYQAQDKTPRITPDEIIAREQEEEASAKPMQAPNLKNPGFYSD